MANKTVFIRVATGFFSLLLALVSLNCAGTRATGNNFETAYRQAVKPYTFDFVKWEFTSFKQLLKAKTSAGIPDRTGVEDWVVEYFRSVAELEKLKAQSDQARANGLTRGLSEKPDQELELQSQLERQRPMIQRILSEQISLVMADCGIYNPLNNDLVKITFPPVSFKIESALNIVVISPREKIERLRESIIRADISAAEIERLETTLEQQNVSALVIPLGGLGATYPSFVIESSDLKYLLTVVAEEWLHQYLAFRPLGFRYVLDLVGIISDPHIAALNETAVGIAAQEIGNLVFQRHYAAYYPLQNDSVIKPGPPAFDFNAVMRETRLRTDALLAAGQVSEAEQYMEKQRQILVKHGYNIRKLNQAYFAFHGTYAYAETSVDPIGEQFRQLRQKSSSLKHYLETVSRMTSRQTLQQSIQ